MLPCLHCQALSAAGGEWWCRRGRAACPRRLRPLHVCKGRRRAAAAGQACTVASWALPLLFYLALMPNMPPTLSPNKQHYPAHCALGCAPVHRHAARPRLRLLEREERPCRQLGSMLRSMRCRVGNAWKPGFGAGCTVPAAALVRAPTLPLGLLGPLGEPWTSHLKAPELQRRASARQTARGQPGLRCALPSRSWLAFGSHREWVHHVGGGRCVTNGMTAVPMPAWAVRRVCR